MLKRIILLKLCVKKLQNSIREVSKFTELNEDVLRYWETEFKQLNPNKNKAGNRTYRQKDIDLILEIKNLLYDEKFTIEGARKVLSQPLVEKKEPIKNNTNTSSMDKKTLMKIQRDLKSILDELQS